MTPDLFFFQIKSKLAKRIKNNPTTAGKESRFLIANIKYESEVIVDRTIKITDNSKKTEPIISKYLAYLTMAHLRNNI